MMCRCTGSNQVLEPRPVTLFDVYACGQWRGMVLAVPSFGLQVCGRAGVYAAVMDGHRRVRTQGGSGHGSSEEGMLGPRRCWPLWDTEGRQAGL